MTQRRFEARANKKLWRYATPGWALWMAWDNPDDRNAIYWIDFRVLSIVGEDGTGVLFHGEDDNPIGDPREAEVVVHGFIKWDGCCQWWADCAHTDTKGEMEELCRVLQDIYHKADEIMGLR